VRSVLEREMMLKKEWIQRRREEDGDNHADPLVAEVEKIFAECLEILKMKRKDYGGDRPPFHGFELYQHIGICTVEQGILSRIIDKLVRIANLLDREPAVQDEKIDDTIKDAINYFAILHAYLREKRGEEG